MARSSSEAYLPMPYGSWGFGVMSSVNGTGFEPYRAMEEHNTNRRTRCESAAEIMPVVAVTMFWVTRCGAKTDTPSYGVAAQ